MKSVKYLFIGVLILLLILFLILNLLFYQIDYIILLVALGVLLLYSIIFQKESLTKIRSFNNLELAKGFPYVIATLPLFYSLLNKNNFPYNREAIIIYWIVFIVAMFNFGIKPKEKKNEKI